jgi:hypothetical protein
MRMSGKVAWIGKDRRDPVGIHLDEPRGNCGGSRNGIQHFKCPSNHGIYVPRSECKVIQPKEVELSLTPPRLSEQRKKIAHHNDDLYGEDAESIDGSLDDISMSELDAVTSDLINLTQNKKVDVEEVKKMMEKQREEIYAQFLACNEEMTGAMEDLNREVVVNVMERVQNIQKGVTETLETIKKGTDFNTSAIKGTAKAVVEIRDDLKAKERNAEMTELKARVLLLEADNDQLRRDMRIVLGALRQRNVVGPECTGSPEKVTDERIIRDFQASQAALTGATNELSNQHAHLSEEDVERRIEQMARVCNALAARLPLEEVGSQVQFTSPMGGKAILSGSNRRSTEGTPIVTLSLESLGGEEEDDDDDDEDGGDGETTLTEEEDSAHRVNDDVDGDNGRGKGKGNDDEQDSDNAGTHVEAQRDGSGLKSALLKKAKAKEELARIDRLIQREKDEVFRG